MGCADQSVCRWTGAKVLASLLLGLVAVLTLVPSPAKAWWNDEWQLRKKITIDASASGANITDPIGFAPVLVRLHVGNFRFSQAKDDGSDLRFVAGDDKTPLKHHIEKYDSLLGEALVWVAVPNLQPGAKADIWLYSGNKKAVATSDPKGTYDPDTQLVYHFNERGTPALDSSVWANNAQTVGQPAEGSLIGTGLRLDGRAVLTLPASPSLALSDNAAFTWSAWIKAGVMQPNAALYSRRDGASGLVIGLDNGILFAEVTNAGTAQRSAGGAPVAPGGWHHVAVVANGGQITLYLDGAPYASLGATLPALNAVALVGGDTAASGAAVAAPSAAAQAPAPSVPIADGAAAPDAAAPAPEAAPV
jgi:biopolymer transport protein ExbB